MPSRPGAISSSRARRAWRRRSDDSAARTGPATSRTGAIGRSGSRDYAACPVDRLRHARRRQPPLTWLLLPMTRATVPMHWPRAWSGGGAPRHDGPPGRQLRPSSESAEVSACPRSGGGGYTRRCFAGLAAGRAPARPDRSRLASDRDRRPSARAAISSPAMSNTGSRACMHRAGDRNGRPAAAVHITVVTNGAAQARMTSRCPARKRRWSPAPPGHPQELPGRDRGAGRCRSFRKGARRQSGYGCCDWMTPWRRGPRRPAVVDLLLEDVLADPANVTAASIATDRRMNGSWARAGLPAAGPGHRGGHGFRDGGTYLITGGMGGIGLALARDLAARSRGQHHPSGPQRPAAARRMGPVITSACCPETNETARRIRAVQEIEAARAVTVRDRGGRCLRHRRDARGGAIGQSAAFGRDRRRHPCRRRDR